MTVSYPPSTVTSTLVFSVPPANGSRAYETTDIDLKTGQRAINYRREKKEVVIENLRGKEDVPTLDTAGFQLVNRLPKHTAFTNDAEIEQEYYPESAELIKEVTGATRVVFFDHTVRRRLPGIVEDTPQTRQPVSHAHIDQTEKSSIARVHRHLPAEEVPALLKRRFQIINLWRPISHPAIDWPLGLCDYRSVDPKNDPLPVTIVFPDRESEAFEVKYNPNQKWNYFHGLKPEEAILLKCFDSIQDGSVATFTPHTGFEDPTTPQGTPYRESIELRALVFY